MLAIIFVVLQYEKSRFDRDPMKEIVVDHVDTFDILADNIERPKNVKTLNSKDYCGKTISKGDYPWPGHKPGNLNLRSDVIKEGNAIRNAFNKKVDYTQDELCYHETAFLQERTTKENLANLKATKVRVTLNPYVGNVRVSNLYMPPGELITVKYLSDDAVGKVSITVNSQKLSEDKAYDFNPYGNEHKYRYPHQQATVSLNRKVSTWGYPFGGCITFSYAGSSAIELEVTGCLRAPLFQYGVTDEEEFANEIKTSVIPHFMMDFGVIIVVGSKNDNVTKTIARVNDVAEFYRSAKTRSQISVKDGFNPRYDRFTNPNIFYFDDYVQGGTASTYGWLNLNNNPEVSSTYMTNFYFSTNGKDEKHFILMHEMNHLHQANFDYSGTHETSNNMHTVMTYNFQSTIPTEKSTTNGVMYGAFFGVAYTSYNFLFKDFGNPYFTYDSSQWSILQHSFGNDKWWEYTDCCYQNKKFPASKFSANGRHILCATDAYKTNIYDTASAAAGIANGNWEGKKDAFLAELKKSPYYDIKFHPLCNFYANGFEKDGVKFTTGFPYRVDPASTSRFDFNWALVYQRTDDKKYGDFEFHSFKGGDRWKEIRKGVYDYKAGANISEVDEFTVDYIDKTDNRITRTYGQIRLSRAWMKNFSYETYEYEKNGVGGFTVPASDNYKRAFKSGKPSSTGTTSEIFVQGNPNVGHLSIVHAYIIPDRDCKIDFGFKSDTSAAIYFSEEPLNGPADDKLILHSTGMIQYPGERPGSVKNGMQIVAGKRYYIDVAYNYFNSPRLELKFQYKDTNQNSFAYREFENSWFMIPNVTDEMIRDNEWKPVNLKIFGLNGWRGKTQSSKTQRTGK